MHAQEEAVKNRQNSRPVFPIAMWEQRQHYASPYGYFMQGAEKAEQGKPFHSARRMGTDCHRVDETDGVVAAGKTRDRWEKNKEGMLVGTTAKQGESARYRQAHGASSGAPCQ